MPPPPVFSMVLDPWAPRTVYAAGDAGVHRSGDYGRSWQARNTGLINKPSGTDTTTINSVALDRLRSDSAKFSLAPRP